MSKKEKAINFYDGKICIRNEDGSLSFEDDSCIPILKEEIDEYIKINSTFSIRDIIFSVIKNHFKVYKTFIPPKKSSFVPNNDKLYIELSKHILDNPIYNSKIKHKNEIRNERDKIAKSKKKDYITYLSYLKSQRNEKYKKNKYKR